MATKKVFSLDQTNKVLTYTILGKSARDLYRIYPENIIAINTRIASSTTTLWGQSTFDLHNKLFMVTTDQDATYRGCSIVDCDLNSAEGVYIDNQVYTNAETLASALIALVAPYKYVSA
jgi:hypothetical protein